jgi:membrane protein implicated in regulation of membrane protease activity
MKSSTATASKRTIKGIATLFDDTERKQLFRKYLLFLGWVEVCILIITVLYQLGNQGYDQSGPIPIPFPWKMYFIISFLTPVAITFLIGVVIVGFDKYLADPEHVEDAAMPNANAGETAADARAASQPVGRMQQFQDVVHQLQRLPFLALLLLLALAVGIFSRLDSILAFVGAVGESSVRIVLMAAGVLLIVVSVFVFVLIVMSYKLRKKSMEYQYRTEMGQRFGLLILEDNTVINSEGRLLIQGKKWRDTVALLPAMTAENFPPDDSPAALPRPQDLKH